MPSSKEKTFNKNIVDAIVSNGAEAAFQRITGTSINEESPDSLKIPSNYLKDVLEAAHLTIIEAYKGCKFEPAISESDKQFLENCESLNPNDFVQMHALIRKLTPAWWEKDGETGIPTVRAIQALRKRIPYDMRQRPSENGMSESMVAVWRSRSTRLPVDDLPDVARRLGVSLHWLMAMPCSTLLFASNANIQTLYDEYTLIPEESRDIIRLTIEHIIERRRTIA